MNGTVKIERVVSISVEGRKRRRSSNETTIHARLFMSLQRVGFASVRQQRYRTAFQSPLDFFGNPRNRVTFSYRYRLLCSLVYSARIMQDVFSISQTTGNGFNAAYRTSCQDICFSSLHNYSSVELKDLTTIISFTERSVSKHVFLRKQVAIRARAE